MTIDLKKECKTEFKNLLPNITGKDKHEACEYLNISRPTFDKYVIKGTMPNIDLAIQIIKFLTERVHARRLALTQSAA